MSVISIPKYDSNVTLPAEAVTAPDAPMQPTATPAPVAPTQPVPQASFLDAVRESNIKRQETKHTSSVVPDATPPPVEKKPDSTPDVFKNAGEESTDVETDTSDDVEFSDPLEADASIEKPTKARNMKELKTHLKTARAREAQVRAQLEEVRAENERLAAFQDKIEEHEKLKERVAQLETYEQIFDIHNNPQFHEKYVAGAENVLSQAKEIAGQYGIKDPNVIEQASKIRNRKDLNEFLKQKGLDEYGISDLRPYIFHLQGLEDERIQLEKSPEEARETLSKMYRESEERRIAEVSKTIQDRTSNAWSQITGYYSRGENAIDAFKDKPGDPEHSERRTSVLKRANDEFVKVMGAFVGLGVKDLPAPIAQTLAARFQLSEWTGEFVAENKALKKQVADLTAQLNDQTTYTRPSFNGTSRNTNGSAPELPKGTDIAGHVFNKARDKVNSQTAR